jgi:hypothetical protein
MATYQELVAQKAAIDAQIEEARKTEVSAAVARSSVWSASMG